MWVIVGDLQLRQMWSDAPSYIPRPMLIWYFAFHCAWSETFGGLHQQWAILEAISGPCDSEGKSFHLHPSSCYTVLKTVSPPTPCTPYTSGTYAQGWSTRPQCGTQAAATRTAREDTEAKLWHHLGDRYSTIIMLLPSQTPHLCTTGERRWQPGSAATCCARRVTTTSCRLRCGHARLQHTTSWSPSAFDAGQRVSKKSTIPYFVDKLNAKWTVCWKIHTF